MRLSFLALLNTLAGHPPYIERAWIMRTNFFGGESRRLSLPQEAPQRILNSAKAELATITSSGGEFQIPV